LGSPSYWLRAVPKTPAKCLQGLIPPKMPAFASRMNRIKVKLCSLNKTVSTEMVMATGNTASVASIATTAEAPRTPVHQSNAETGQITIATNPLMRDADATQANRFPAIRPILRRWV